jgi:putative ATPase
MNANVQTPLAERMRPHRLDEVLGQPQLAGPEGILTQWAEAGAAFPSMIFWGPPGSGKTTLAQVVARETGLPFISLSAISAGVREVRQAIDQAAKAGRVLLFVDEIHRFHKGQQDALLGAVEEGSLLLIGATTENPSFEVNSALLSRCQVFALEPLGEDALMTLARRALERDPLLSALNIRLEETEALLAFSGGDARRLLNLLEMVVNAQAGSGVPPVIDNRRVAETAQQRSARYDKAGEQHYDIISAFIKTLRGSDPQAGLYWLARMLAGGEDPKFIARRMLILASEDIGNANPNALLLANACFEAVERIGMPEARIILAQTVVYMASSEKSNASYVAINEAQQAVRETGDLPVPLHLRNAPTRLMKGMGYSLGYRYAHDYPGHFVEQEFMPEGMEGRTFYRPANNAREQQFRQRLQGLWKSKYKL